MDLLVNYFRNVQALRQQEMGWFPFDNPYSCEIKTMIGINITSLPNIYIYLWQRHNWLNRRQLNQ